MTDIKIKQKIGEIQKQISDVHKRLKENQKVTEDFWRKEIRLYAKLLREQYELLGTEFLIPTISETIRNKLAEDGLKVAEYVDVYLESIYKSSKKDTSKFRQGKPIDLDEVIREIKDNIDQGRFDGKLSDVDERLSKLRNLTASRARVNKESIAPHGNYTTIDYINEEKERSREPVTIDRPEAKPDNVLAIAIRDAAETLHQVADEVEQFPPEIKEKAEEYAEAWRDWTTTFKPGLDAKWTKDWRGWWRAEKYRDIFGKHASGVMSYSVSNLCANCSDEKTKEWVRMEPVYAQDFSIYECPECRFSVKTQCPKCNILLVQKSKPQIGWICENCEGTVPMQRNLTREQVGDKTSIIVDNMEKMAEHMPEFMAFCDWYSKWKEPYAAGRKIRLSQDLSDRA